MSVRVSVCAGVAGALLLGSSLGLGVVIAPRAVSAQSNPAAAAEVRFQTLEQEIRSLTGQVERQHYEIQQLQAHISSLQKALNVQPVHSLAPSSGVEAEKSAGIQGDVYSGEPYTGASSAQSIQAKPLHDGDGASVSAHRSSASAQGIIEPADFDDPTVRSLGTFTREMLPPTRDGAQVNNSGDLVVASTGGAAGDYDRAYSFIKARDFERAEQAFGAFIESYPEHDLLSNAKYWYGETFYVRGDYDRAARIFAEAYKSHPKGQKVASNLLKLGMALVEMNKPEDACIAFKQLKKDYANSAVPVLKRADIEMNKINCQ
ncbi:MAG: tol-pal system protein YbgF [Alphaproteobacteria bacterium]